MDKKEKILINGMMPKDKKINPGYDETYRSQLENIEIFILMYGTKDLEKVLNKVFAAHNIEKIEIKLKHKTGKTRLESPIKLTKQGG